MDQITLKNFRCFRDHEPARLAPLTLLVGENSTGKTSFMAMIRALWDVAHRQRVPDFKEPPYDLGSFDEIAHFRGGRAGRADKFEAGFRVVPAYSRGKRRARTNRQPYHFNVIFEKRGTAPSPMNVRLFREKVWIEDSFKRQARETKFGTPRGSWKFCTKYADRWDIDDIQIWPRLFSPMSRRRAGHQDSETEIIASQGSEKPTDKDWQLIEELIDAYRSSAYEYSRNWPYANAPVRSKPRRTYDPSPAILDPEGKNVPMLLASLYFRKESEWKELKNALENFGKRAGLFDEISIKPLGKRDSEPFQMQVRKFGGKAKGPWRNLIDVGYGVSQVLPVVTDLFRSPTPPMFLLQQPEVHLHPSAQAALGSLFCEVIRPGRQLVVETHSDHLLDRVRMDVRDNISGNKTGLKPDDVSILFFERSGLDVHIHSLRIDEEGNIADAPQSYRKFFMEETTRSLGLL